MRVTYEVMDEHTDDPAEFIRVKVESQMDEHHLHPWERTETLVDNPIEHTQWGYCQQCEKEFMIRSVTWIR